MAAASWLEGSREMLEGKAPALDRVSLAHALAHAHTRMPALSADACVCTLIN